MESRICSGDQERRAGHAFHSAGNDNFGVAGANDLIGQHHGLQSGAAHFVDRQRGDRIGESCAEGGLPGRRLPQAGRKDVAHDYFVDRVGRQSGAAHGFGHDDRA
jgi:hypothetical protein